MNFNLLIATPMDRLALTDDILADIVIVDLENNYYSAIDFKQEQVLVTRNGKQFVTLGLTSTILKDLSMYHLIVRNDTYERAESNRVRTVADLALLLKQDLGVQVYYRSKPL